jgi:hypothetical protein
MFRWFVHQKSAFLHFLIFIIKVLSEHKKLTLSQAMHENLQSLAAIILNQAPMYYLFNIINEN